MNNGNRKRWHYGKGYINETKNGTFAAFVALGKSKCRRARFKTLAEAKAWINVGKAGDTHDELLIEDGLRARSLLPDDITLEEAARFWADNHKSVTQPAKISEAWEKYQADALLRLRHRTLSSYRQFKSRLIEKFGDIQINLIDDAKFESFVADMSNEMRNNAIRCCGAFFSFCVCKGIMTDNPCRKISKARTEASAPSVLSVDAARTLMNEAEKYPAVAAYFALCCFAGVRPEEARRLRAANIQNGFVVLDASITKTADARTVKIRDNLRKWLELYPIPEKGFSEKKIRAVRAAFAKNSKTQWAQDICRHSFATYSFEDSHNAAATAAELGHAGTAIFFKHYRALAVPESGKKYFAIFPHVC